MTSSQTERVSASDDLARLTQVMGLVGVSAPQPVAPPPSASKPAVAAAPAGAPSAPVEPDAVTPRAAGLASSGSEPKREAATRRAREAGPTASNAEPVQVPPEGTDAVGEGATRPRSVRVDRDVAALLTAVASSGRSYTETTLLAVERYHEAAPHPEPPAERGLFRARGRRAPVDRTLVSLYLNDDETALLDRLAANVGLNRSDLVSRALRAELAHRVFCPMPVFLWLSRASDPATQLRERLMQASQAAPFLRQLPVRLEMWQELPGEWVRSCSEELSRVQQTLQAPSWTAVVWTVLGDIAST